MTCQNVSTACVPLSVSLTIVNLSCTDTASRGNITATASGGTQPYTFIWSTGDTFRLSTGDSTSVITGLTFGTYYITVTDAAGCMAIDTAAINYSSCCLNDTATSVIPITGDTVYSNTLNIPAGSNVYIAPYVVLIVDSALTLQQCTVVLGAGAEIIDNDTLVINGSTLKGCDTLWNGIYVDSSDYILVENDGSDTSIIEDAMNGIVVGHNVLDVFFINSNFYRNQYSIEFLNYIPLAGNDYQVSNNYFGMSTYSALLPAPAGHANYNRPIAGISIATGGPLIIPNILNTNGMPSTAPNIFQYMNYGIKDSGCSLSVYQNFFDSILNYDSSASYKYGSAIWAYPNFTNSTLSLLDLLVETDTSAADSNSVIHFLDCGLGVNAEAFKLTVLNNRMENVTYGVYSTGCHDSVTINNNYIHLANFGVSLINNSAAVQNVWYDTIFVNNPYITVERVHTFNGGSLTLLVFNSTYGIEETELAYSNTTISNNAVWSGFDGIELINAIGTAVQENQVHLTANVPMPMLMPEAGIYAVNGKNLGITANYCYGDTDAYIDQAAPFSGNAYSTFNKVGIWINTARGGDTSGVILCSNVLGGNASSNGIGYGVMFSGNCDNSHLYNDTMNRSRYGLVVQSLGTAVIPNQGNLSIYQNNNFIGGFTNDSGDASYVFNYTNFHLLRPIFYYLDTQAISYHPSNNGTTVPNQEIEFVPLLSGSYPLCDTVRRLRLIVTRFDSIVAEDSAAYYMEQAIDTSGPWLMAKMVYESLYNDTAILNNDSLMNAFYAQIDSGEIGKIYSSEMENQYLASLASDSEDYAEELIKAQSLLGILPDSTIQAQNYKTINTIYLQTIAAGIDTFSSNQLYLIDSIAVQCPYVAGDAVYFARALYAQYDNSVFYDDDMICTPDSVTGFSLRELCLPTVNSDSDTTAKKIEPIEFVKVYPNPARQIINLNFYAQTTGQVEFELMDQLGVTVISAFLGAGQNFAQYSTGRLTDGIYYWRLNDSQRTIKTDKIAIMK